MCGSQTFHPSTCTAIFVDPRRYCPNGSTTHHVGLVDASILRGPRSQAQNALTVRSSLGVCTPDDALLIDVSPNLIGCFEDGVREPGLKSMKSTTDPVTAYNLSHWISIVNQAANTRGPWISGKLRSRHRATTHPASLVVVVPYGSLFNLIARVRSSGFYEFLSLRLRSSGVAERSVTAVSRVPTAFVSTSVHVVR